MGFHICVAGRRSPVARFWRCASTTHKPMKTSKKRATSDRRPASCQLLVAGRRSSFLFVSLSFPLSFPVFNIYIYIYMYPFPILSPSFPYPFPIYIYIYIYVCFHLSILSLSFSHPHHFPILFLSFSQILDKSASNV